jgi:hypothetical protein
MDWPITVYIPYDNKTLSVLAWMHAYVGQVGVDWDYMHIDNINYICFSNELDRMTCKLKFGV